MTIRNLFALLLGLVVTHGLLGVVFALEPVTIIVDQPDAPLKLSNYSAHYAERNSSSRVRDGIRHHPSYTNVSDREIVALRIGFVSFNYFNEFIGKMNGIAKEIIPPEGSNEYTGNTSSTKSGVWIQSRSGDFAFHTGVAYVDKVRFEDGEVWSADLDEVMAELEKIEADFDKSRLEESEDP